MAKGSCNPVSIRSAIPKAATRTDKPFICVIELYTETSFLKAFAIFAKKYPPISPANMTKNSRKAFCSKKW
jgi:hypothetical protein